MYYDFLLNYWIWIAVIISTVLLYFIILYLVNKKIKTLNNKLKSLKKENQALSEILDDYYDSFNSVEDTLTEFLSEINTLKDNHTKHYS